MGFRRHIRTVRVSDILQCCLATVPALRTNNHIIIFPILNMSDSSIRAPIYGPRPYDLGEKDQRGCVLIISILFIIYTCMVLMIRLISRQRNVGPDDWLSVVAAVCSRDSITDGLTECPQFTGLRNIAVRICRCRNSQWELRLFLQPPFVK